MATIQIPENPPTTMHEVITDMVTVVVKHAMERGVRRMKKLSRIELNCTYANGTGTWSGLGLGLWLG